MFFLVGLLGIAALEWRLSRGSMQLPWLASRIEARVQREYPGARVQIGALSVASPAWRDGPDAPLVMTLADAVAAGPGGASVVAAPSASVALALPPLLLADIRPRTVEADGVRLQLRRNDSGIGLDLGQPRQQPGKATSEDAWGLGNLLQAVAHPQTPGESEGRAALLSQMQRISLHECQVSIVDEQLDATWLFFSSAFEIARHESGAVEGGGNLAVALGGQAATLDIAATVDPGAAATHARLRLDPVNPAFWIADTPKLAPLATLNAPVSAEITGDLGPDLGLRHLHAEANVAEGLVLMNGAAVALLEGSLTADGTLDRLTLNRAQVVLRGGADSRPSTIGLSGAVAKEPPGLVVTGALSLNQVAFADLALLWPEQAGTNARRWVTRNITDGTARDAHVDFVVTTPLDLSDVQLTQAAGALQGDDLTVHWLRPVPPIQHGAAVLRILDPDTIEIVVTGGRQQPSGARVQDPRAGLAIRGGTVRITGIEQPHQFGAIVADIDGPLADAIGLLSEKRLKLLSEHPIPLKNPSGHAAVKLTLTVPLEDAVQIEDIPIRALGHLDDVAISDLVAGQGVERGVADLDVTQDGMSAFGTAVAARIPVNFAGDMDFRAGPPSQILERVTLTGRGSIDQLADAGIDARSAMSGLVALRAQLVQRRSGEGQADVAADLTDTVLTAAPLDWQKAAGTPAGGSARVRLLHGRLVALEDIALSGPDLDVRGHAAFTAGRPTLLRFGRLKVGRSEMAAQVRFPAKPGAGPIAATVSGPVLDLSARLTRKRKRSEPQPPQSAAPEGTPWSVAARFDHVLTGKAHDLSAVRLSAENDGRLLRRLHAEAQAGPAGRLRADITPEGRGRRLTGAAEDVGTVLNALGLLDGIEGGALTVSGAYDDTRPDHPLTAEARVGPFRVTDAPFAARLLKAITIYGIADLLRGPGIGVTQVIAPFTLTGDYLDLGESRAVSPSLGVTARGRVDLKRSTADIRGTIVPAYFFNSLPGKIPLIGKLFSPEPGGGLFAADFTVRGPLDDPSVSVNPLSVLTPGALRKLFGH